MAAIGDYPLTNFHFVVEWGADFRIGFTEIHGLDFETEVIEYREGSSKNYNASKQPGRTKYSDVTLKRGVFQGDFDFFKEWQKTYFFQEGNNTGSKYRRDIAIRLLDEKHEPVITWLLKKAWPRKVQSTVLKADSNEIAIETMILVHEGLTILEAN
ncbi:phage tail protein [Aequorivita marina]|uniref:phage tail protein n=1 Tax=Aequorivita marina TaxID=3073654 RepID=UPI00287403F5|nr:phage tail protein [Aequorivita sp. S2608]MDS1297768.1 phage tail protein [Aequorivita sp. S2608]